MQINQEERAAKLDAFYETDVQMSLRSCIRSECDEFRLRKKSALCVNMRSKNVEGTCHPVAAEGV
jgi:hypothetical protein